MTQDKWLTERLIYIRGLKAPNDQQKLMLMLIDNGAKNVNDARKLAALLRAEKATERAQKARADAARIINADKSSLRKARDHELYQSAGLMILAGLVDSKTGLPTWDKGELLGALASLGQANAAPEKRAEWKARGDALFVKKAA